MTKKSKHPRLRLEDALRERGITKYRLAQLLGKPTAAVSVYFRDGYNPTFQTLVTWAEALDCKVRDLIEE